MNVMDIGDRFILIAILVGTSRILSNINSYDHTIYWIMFFIAFICFILYRSYSENKKYEQMANLLKNNGFNNMYIISDRKPDEKDCFIRGTLWSISGDFDLSEGVYIQTNNSEYNPEWIYFKKQ